MVLCAGLVALALSACGGKTPAAGSTPQATATQAAGSSPAATATATTPSVKRCSTADLSLSTESGGAAAGTHFLSLVLTNTSGADCSLTGFPGVSLIDGAGKQIGQPADRNPSVMPQTVTLGPGESAHATAGFPNYQNFPAGKCSGPSTALKIYPPDELNALTVPVVDYSCPGFSVQSVQPGTNDPGRS